MRPAHLSLVTGPQVGSKEALVLAARTGDRAAQRALYVASFRWVERLAFRLMPWRGEAEDLMQDTFAEAFLRLDRLTEPARFDAWLRQIVIGLAHKRARRLVLFTPRERREPIDFDACETPDASPEVRAELRLVWAELEALPDALRLVFVLRFVEGMTIPEIAGATSQSEATVKRRLTDATQRLRAAGVLT